MNPAGGVVLPPEEIEVLGELAMASESLISIADDFGRAVRMMNQLPGNNTAGGGRVTRALTDQVACLQRHLGELSSEVMRFSLTYEDQIAEIERSR